MIRAALPAPATAPRPAPAAALDAPLVDYLDRLMADLHARVPAALNNWDVEGIHQARVATRRLKAALDLMKPVLGKKRRQPLARVLRKLRRRLGPLRDADVMLGHAEELASSAPKRGAAARWLARHLVRERDRLREQSREEAPASRVLQDLGAWHPVREQIVAAQDGVRGLLGESLHRQLDGFVEEAARVVAGLEQSGSEDAETDATRPDPHQLRIAGKALRYTLEMAVAAGHVVPRSVLKTFKAMQENLGAWHDYVVLTDKAMSASLTETLSHREPGMQERVLGLACMTVRRSAKELQQFAKLWNAKGPALASAVRQAFPASGSAGPVTEPETGHGPPDSAPAGGRAVAPPGGPPAAP